MAATRVVSRENIESWAADSPKLLHFRRALEGMQAVSEQALMDERGYQWVAGVHGGFGGMPFCHHGDLHFITWHRPYVLDMELKLRAQIALFADQATADEWRLPYWAWDAEDVTGLPAAFTDETYVDGGETKPNPLFSRPYQLPVPVDLDPSDRTWRDPRPLPVLQALRPLVLEALELGDYTDFVTAIENPHNRIHTWVRGFMATFRSAFDPIFWVHHCNVDRQLWTWQQGVGHMSTVPQAVRDLQCQPFKFVDIRAEAFFDTRALGYTYAEERRLVPRAAARRQLESLTPAPAPTAPLPLPFGPAPSTPYTRARINVHGVRHPERNCELLFFAARATPPRADTPRTAEEGFLGSYTILGHGPCPGAPGHCDPDQPVQSDLRPPHHLAPFDLFVDVTTGLQQLAAGAELDAQLIVVDIHDEALPTDTVRFDNATLTLR